MKMLAGRFAFSMLDRAWWAWGEAARSNATLSLRAPTARGGGFL